LVHGMRAYFQVNGIPANVTACGWKQRSQQLNQGPGGAMRIVLYPGREPSGSSGAAGTLTRGHRPSTDNPRALVTWEHQLTMSVWAVDKTDTYNEELQISAVETLLEYAIQAVHNAVDPTTNTPVGLAAIEWGDVRYTLPPIEMRFGQEIMVEFMHKCPLFDQAISKAFPQGSVARGEK
jgi:hypothetical protein